VKYLVVVLILVSFLPLYKGFSSQNGDILSKQYQLCLEKDNLRTVDESCETDARMRKMGSHSDCSIDHSVECQEQNRFILPLDIFLAPIKERAPQRKTVPAPILS